MGGAKLAKKKEIKSLIEQVLEQKMHDAQIHREHGDQERRGSKRNRLEATIRFGHQGCIQQAIDPLRQILIGRNERRHQRRHGYTRLHPSYANQRRREGG